MFKTETPAGSENFEAIMDQMRENDKLNRALNDAAVLITGLTRGKIVAWSTANSRWELYDGTVAPEATTMLGIVEYVGSPDTSGGVRVTGVYLDEALTSNTAYYCQADGTLGTTETATFIGICTNAGRLVMQGRGSGAGGSGASIGTGNYIAEPFDVLPGTGLQVLVGANRCVIDETAVESTAQTAVALTAKAAQLVFKKKDGTYDKLLPKMTAADLVDTDTIGCWPFSAYDGSSAVPNAAVGVNSNTVAVANNFTKAGTVTAVDGYFGNAARPNGSDGYLGSQNLTGVPVGASARTLHRFFTCTTISKQYNTIADYGGGSTNCFRLRLEYARLKFADGNTLWDTGYDCEVGKDYYVAITYDGTTIRIYVNGLLAFSVAASLNTATSVVLLSSRTTGAADFGQFDDHFFMIDRVSRTPAQIAALAQELLIPCAYSSVYMQDPSKLIDGGTYSGYDIKNILDNDTAKMWVSSQTGAGVNGAAYFGCSGLSVPLRQIRYLNDLSYSDYGVTSVKVQCNNGSGWVDLLTATVSAQYGTWNTLNLPPYAWANNHSIRVLANSSLLTTWAWRVLDAEFIYAYPIKTDIRDALTNKAESQVVCFTRTDDNNPVIIIAPNDPQGATPDWAYGIRVGPMGLLNRKKRLGYKHTALGATQRWDDPFGTRDLSFEVFYAQDATGRNAVPIDQNVSGTYGYFSEPTSAKPIGIVAGSTAIARINGSWQGAGYIEAIAEVID